MNKNVITAVVGSLCALLLCEPHSLGQTPLSASNLDVTGTTTLNTLNVSGPAALNALTVSGTTDLLGNSLFFGSWLNNLDQHGVSLLYTDGTSAASPARLTFSATRPLPEWLWEREKADQTGTVPMMKLDANHVLTIYNTAGTAAIVLDPALGLITVNGASAIQPGSGDFSVVIGSGTASGNNSTAINDGLAKGVYSTVMSGGEAWGDHSTAMSGGYTVGVHSTGMSGGTAGANNSTAMSSGQAWGENSMAMSSGQALANNSTAMSGGQAHGDGSTAMSGGYTDSDAWNSTAMSGGDADAAGSTAMSGGRTSYDSLGSTAMSDGQTIGYGATAMSGGQAIGDGSTAMGWQATARAYRKVAVGQNNIQQGDPYNWVSSDDLFVVGNGSMQPNVPANAFVVKKNGDTTVYGALTVSATDGSTATTPSGFSIAYDDGTDGANSAITLQSSRPLTAWNWQRMTASGTPANVMQIDASNRLILTGTATTNPPQLVLDPNSTGTASILTQGLADSRYITSANFKVGTTTDGTVVYPTIALTGGTATGAYSFAGIKATAWGNYSTAIGYGSSAFENYTTVIGYGSSANGFDSTAIGYCSTADGFDSTAIGYCSSAIGNDSTVIGNGSTASNLCATAIGNASTASGDSSTAIGCNSTASGDASTASGFFSTASGIFSTAAGAYTTANGYGQFVVGVYNTSQGDPYNWVPTDELFTVGNGVDSSHRSNAFIVKKNGDTTVYGKLTVSGTSGGLVITGTAVPVTLTSGTAATKIVASGSNQLVLVAEQGDLSMGDFINGAKPQ